MIQCPNCGSSHIRKNGKRGDSQNHICVDCGRQFLDKFAPPRGYSQEVKELCLKCYLNGLGFRAIERVTGVHHTTIINWVKQIGAKLNDAVEPDSIPDVGELDELETFVKKKTNKVWIWTVVRRSSRAAVDHFREGILAWAVGDHKHFPLCGQLLKPGNAFL